MMTSEPVILGPDATVAEALAHAREPDLPVSLAAMVYVCRQPLETPTGRLVGVRPHPAAAARAAVDAGRGRRRQGPRRAAARGDHRPGGGLPGDVQPGRGAGRRRRGPAAGRGDRRRPPRPHAPRELARPDRARSSREPAWLSRAATASTPRRRTSSRWSGGRRYDEDAFGVFAEQFARFMGTARFLAYMTAVRPDLGLLEPARARRPEVGRVPLHLPDPDAQPAGVVRRAADPARPEPAGAAGQGHRRAGPPGQHPGARRHGVPRPRGGLAADGRRRGRHPRLPALGAAFAAGRDRRALRRLAAPLATRS